MAVAKVTKLRIIIHQSEHDRLLAELQRASILHIDYDEKSLPPDEMDQLHMRLERVILELSEGEKKSFLASVLPEKEPISRSDVESVLSSIKIDHLLNEYLETKKRVDELKSELERIEEELRILSPWSRISYDPSYWRRSSFLSLIPVSFPNREVYESALAGLGEREIELSPVNEVGGVQCLLLVPKEKEAEARFWVGEQGGEIVELPAEGDIQAHLAELEQNRSKLREQLQVEVGHLNTFKTLIDKFRIVYDTIAIDRDRRKLSSLLPKTATTAIITGWIKERDRKQLEEIIGRTETGILEYLSPAEEDQPPVALENRPIFKPFELIVNLYSPPNPKEVDPSPLIAFFFVFFFGLCITDAMYGIILALLAYLGLKKLRSGRELLWILFGGGLVTIIPGAVTGGWFGNLFELLPFPILNEFRNRLMLFDPMKDPMPFFYFALLVGYLQVMFGIAVEAYDSFRNRDYATGIFNNITWIIFLNSLPLMIILRSWRPVLGLLAIVNACLILVFTRRGGVSIIDQLLFFFFFLLLVLRLFSHPLQIPFSINPYLILIPLIGIILRFRRLKKMLKKLAWGVYGLYNGTVSFISAVISYVRLMALGMVTAGIAMVINTVIGMISGIPVAGIIIGLLIFIGGTIFNIAINTLGGFIHTMRLQYVEFFQRFYVGGGRRFVPFGYNTKFYELRR